MTLIALTSDDLREVTDRAGPCRGFLLYQVEDGRISRPCLLQLPAGESLQDRLPDQAHPLDSIDVLISGGIEETLRQHLARRGIRAVLTAERNPLRAMQRWVDEAPADDADAALARPVPQQPATGQPPADEPLPAGGCCGVCGRCQRDVAQPVRG